MKEKSHMPYKFENKSRLVRREFLFFQVSKRMAKSWWGLQSEPQCIPVSTSRWTITLNTSAGSRNTSLFMHVCVCVYCCLYSRLTNKEDMGVLCFLKHKNNSDLVSNLLLTKLVFKIFKRLGTKGTNWDKQREKYLNYSRWSRLPRS